MSDGYLTTAAPYGNSTDADAPESAFILNLTWDDANWILTASFIIFTMQTGFGMLESGCVSVKNEANIMMKNVVDVVFGGFTYWAFGFSVSFGNDPPYSTPYFGVGEYMVDAEHEIMGPVFACFMFQLSFATTATTIVSGTMAERCNFKSYCLFSCLNTVVYCVPARWIWGPTGFLKDMGVIDIAGSGAVHLLGGVSGYVAAWMLGPRLGRYDNGPTPLPLGNPTSCIVGLYILWWGWLAFNSGSTFGISGVKWKFAARAATSTLIASIGGGIAGSAWTLARPGNIFQVMDIVNPVLGALVAVTAGCALYHTLDGFIVGLIGGITILLTSGFTDWTRVDDPVGATPVHAFGGLMGLVCVGLFAEDDQDAGFSQGRSGLFRGGGWYLLKVQIFASLCISVWAATITFILLYITNKIIPIRMEPHEELLGADYVEHLVRRRYAGISAALSVVGSHPDLEDAREKAGTIGASNPSHDKLLVNMTEMNIRRWSRVKNLTQAMSMLTRVKGKPDNAITANLNQVVPQAQLASSTIPEYPEFKYQNEHDNLFLNEYSNFNNENNKRVHFNYLDYLGRPQAQLTQFAWEDESDGRNQPFYYSNENPTTNNPNRRKPTPKQTNRY